ncbi:Hypothetical_protein [Hexamita inflata]|uniref:Hypothetical_protein n=1 Tax=Hexamita inflata TaxID=28002 RepID=A0AA86P3V7_9EUKA|nr:Hypothetical protein HINF_LOCUS19084 [Hexamita inflata]
MKNTSSILISFITSLNINNLLKLNRLVVIWLENVFQKLSEFNNLHLQIVRTNQSCLNSFHGVTRGWFWCANCVHLDVCSGLNAAIVCGQIQKSIANVSNVIISHSQIQSTAPSQAQAAGLFSHVEFVMLTIFGFCIDNINVTTQSTQGVSAGIISQCNNTSINMQNLALNKIYVQSINDQLTLASVGISRSIQSNLILQSISIQNIIIQSDSLNDFGFAHTRILRVLVFDKIMTSRFPVLYSQSHFMYKPQPDLQTCRKRFRKVDFINFHLRVK